jgi:hypothetical protein
MSEFEGATLTPAETEALASKLISAANQFATEFNALADAPASVTDLYTAPGVTVSAWCNAAADAMFSLAEVRGSSAVEYVTRTGYWSR